MYSRLVAGGELTPNVGERVMMSRLLRQSLAALSRPTILVLAASAALASLASQASAATCPSSDLGFGLITVNTTPASSCLGGFNVGYGDGNIGQGSGDAITALGYTMLSNTDPTSAAFNGILTVSFTDPSNGAGTFLISGVPSGFDTFVLGLKDGNIGIIDATPNPDIQFNWGAFLLGALGGSWSIETDGGTLKALSHAVLYGLACGDTHPCAPPPPGEVPLPAALPLFASGAGLLGFFGWRRKKRMAQLAA